MKRILVTGAAGFIGRNLCTRLAETGRHQVLGVTRDTSMENLSEKVGEADAIIHLAGVNRNEDPQAFRADNVDFTGKLCDLLEDSGRVVPIVFASSTQANRETVYGRTKQAAEQRLERYSAVSEAPVAIFRLANVFGKWCRPNYNSVVATFCHNIARDLPIAIHDPRASLRLVYIDDVVDSWLDYLEDPAPGLSRPEVLPEHRTTVGELAAKIRSYRTLRETHTVDDVGVGFSRALYATYVSSLPAESFSYPLTTHSDPRGVFVEMLRTETSGQFSYFTAHPGVTRGGHYHHTKTEKFLVLKGQARFRFRDIATDEVQVIETSGDSATVVETVPGWAHDITNIGNEEMVVMLWANETFDPSRPDTVVAEVTP